MPPAMPRFRPFHLRLPARFGWLQRTQQAWRAGRHTWSDSRRQAVFHFVVAAALVMPAVLWAFLLYPLITMLREQKAREQALAAQQKARIQTMGEANHRAVPRQIRTLRDRYTAGGMRGRTLDS